MKLTIIDSKENGPSQNLEQEDTLKNLVSDENYLLRFWINDPVLVMGRFQKEIYEANIDYLKANNIPILKRSTGGGTVYHDHGTLNITFCKPKNPLLKEGQKDSTTFISLIASALKDLEFDVRQDERNGLYIGGKKILGSAASLTDNTLLVHCSLLVKTNLDTLEKAINWEPKYPSSENGASHVFVKSVRSPVMNLTTLKPDLTMEILKKNIEHKIKILIEKLP